MNSTYSHAQKTAPEQYLYIDTGNKCDCAGKWCAPRASAAKVRASQINHTGKWSKKYGHTVLKMRAISVTDLLQPMLRKGYRAPINVL